MRLGNRTIHPKRPARSGLRRPARGQGEPATHVRPEIAPRVEPQRTPNGPENREKRTGGPQDRALYGCGCGAAFQAPVSASVRCPHCGESQAW